MSAHSDSPREAAMTREDALQKVMGLICDANQNLPVQAYASDVRALRRLLELLAETEQRLTGAGGGTGQVARDDFHLQEP